MKTVVMAIRRHRLVRFAAVGLFNTLFDLFLFNLFLYLTNTEDKTTIIICNSISATIVATVSFFLNRGFVFRSRHTSKKHALSFIVITLSGLYIIQNGIIYIFLHFFTPLGEMLTDVAATFGFHHLNPDLLLANFAKLTATGGSMFWSYMWYSRVIFRSPKRK